MLPPFLHFYTTAPFIRFRMDSRNSRTSSGQRCFFAHRDYSSIPWKHVMHTSPLLFSFSGEESCYRASSSGEHCSIKHHRFSFHPVEPSVLLAFPILRLRCIVVPTGHSYCHASLLFAFFYFRYGECTVTNQAQFFT